MEFKHIKEPKEGEIIQDIDSIHYLDPYLLKVHLINEEIELISEGKEISKTPENFQKIIEYKQQSKLLPYNPVYPILYKYTEEDYQGMKRISDTDSRLLKFLHYWNTDEINMVEIYDLIKKLPKSFSEPTSPPLNIDKLNAVVETYLYDQRKPLNDDISKTLINTALISPTTGYESILIASLRLIFTDIIDRIIPSKIPKKSDLFFCIKIFFY